MVIFIYGNKTLYLGLHVKCLAIVRIWPKLDFLDRFSWMHQYVKLYENPSSCSHADTCGVKRQKKGKGKVKCTLVQVLRLCTVRRAHKGSRGIALPFLDHGTRRGWGVSVTPRPLFTLWKDPALIVQEAVWAPGTVWTGGENLAPHRDSIPGPSSP